MPSTPTNAREEYDSEVGRILVQFEQGEIEYHDAVYQMELLIKESFLRGSDMKDAAIKAGNLQAQLDIVKKLKKNTEYRENGQNKVINSLIKYLEEELYKEIHGKSN